MNILNWFPAIMVTSMFAFALWLGRNLISVRLAKSVQHEFDQKIESVKTNLRASEERFKAQLREKETEIATLRSGALSVLASRHAALDKRRLEAVDQLWSSYNDLAPARAIAIQMSIVKFESAASEAEHNPKLRQAFDIIGNGFDSKKIEFTGATLARPYVTPMVWAVFSAISAITVHSVICFQIIKGGLGKIDLGDDKTIKKLVNVVLPHYSEYLQNGGASVYPNILEALEVKLLDEINNMLSGAESDKVNVQQASEIMKEAKALQAVTDKEADIFKADLK